MAPRPLGPSPAPGSLLPPNEKLPSSEAYCLKGHEGPVLAVRFNSQGTYCLTCGKVRCFCGGLVLHPLEVAGRDLLFQG
jgi:hypothetical protein